MSHLEVEVKLLVPDHTAVREKLDAIGARVTHERVFERNVRYENAVGTLTNSGVVLRLRQDHRVRLTYKDGNQSVGDGILSRFEAEVTVDNFDTMHTILVRLGYTPYMTYEKYRTTYHLDDAEIVLDEMPYGSFVEVEADATTIESVITRLNLNRAPRFDVSYVALFDRVRSRLGMNVKDLTFENFKGVDVPPEAFKGG